MGLLFKIHQQIEKTAETKDQRLASAMRKVIVMDLLTSTVPTFQRSLNHENKEDKS